MNFRSEEFQVSAVVVFIALCLLTAAILYESPDKKIQKCIYKHSGPSSTVFENEVITYYCNKCIDIEMSKEKFEIKCKQN
jgi:hypothetical protein